MKEMEKRLIWKRKVDHARVSCAQGSCWITWKGSKDVILQAGECLEVNKVRGLCVEFLGNGKGQVEETGRTEARLSLLRLPASADAMRSVTRACW
jgi:hypothetical protein